MLHKKSLLATYVSEIAIIEMQKITHNYGIFNVKCDCFSQLLRIKKGDSKFELEIVEFEEKYNLINFNFGCLMLSKITSLNREEPFLDLRWEK